MGRIQPLFKYLPREFAEKALRGGFRITTYETCRNKEKIGEERVDRKEGTALLSMVVEEWDSQSGNELPAFIPIKPQPGSHISIHGTEFAVGHRIDDAYLYCMSTDYDPALLERFKCDSCLIIKDWQRFIYHLGRASPKTRRLLKVDDVDYDERLIKGRYKNGKHEWENKHPAFIKPAGYKVEREVRAVWITDDLPIAPIDVWSTEAASLCEIYEPGRVRRKLAIEL